MEWLLGDITLPRWLAFLVLAMGLWDAIRLGRARHELERLKRSRASTSP